jgi:putative addiction module component (TIGR02574 family)
MTKTEKLIEQATKLPEADRIRLAERILATLDGEPDSGAAEAWAQEIERRSREIELGLVLPVPWSEVKEAAARKARERR